MTLKIRNPGVASALLAIEPNPFPSVVCTTPLLPCFGAQNPSYKAFLGTNGIVVVTNTTTDKVIIDGAGLAGSVIQVWTNDAGVIYIVVDPSRIIFYTNMIVGRQIRADGTNTALGSMLPCQDLVERLTLPVWH